MKELNQMDLDVLETPIYDRKPRVPARAFCASSRCARLGQVSRYGVLKPGITDKDVWICPDCGDALIWSAGAPSAHGKP